jgi:hypothetical protein
VTSIEENALEGCSSLTEINVDSGNANYSSDGGVLFDKNKITLILCPKGKSGLYNIPNGVESIGRDTFSGCSSLAGITISSSVASIGDYAFYGCSSLINVTIPNSVTSIGERAFAFCSSLTEINVDSGNANYDSDDGVLFDENKNTLIVCPEGKIGTYTIPNSVTSIEDGAFSYCSNLTSITILGDVNSIGDRAFSDCSSLTSITIPACVTTIGEYAFYFCSSLTSITIPNSVTSIGKLAFGFCSSLAEINVDSGNENYASDDGVLFNKDKAVLIVCPGGKTGSFTIPNSMTKIEDYTFDGCGSLTGVTIPDSVTSIGHYAFRDCSSLTSMIIPNSVTSMGEFAFRDCSSLTDVTISNSVGSIGEGAFYTCSGLTSIVIPNSVTTIGDYAFGDCSSLANITIPNRVDWVGSEAFSGCLGPIYCQASSKPYEWSYDWNSDYTGQIYWGQSAPDYDSPQVNVDLQSISLDKSSLELNAGDSAKLTVNYNPADTTEKPVAHWTSSDVKVATVDASGNVTGMAAGTATIAATVNLKSGAKTATCAVTVRATQAPPAVNPDTTPDIKPDTTPNIKSDVKAAAPKKLAAPKAKVGKKQIKITWEKSSTKGISGYQVQYRIVGKKWTTKKAGAKAKSLTIKKLKFGKKYEVRVRAYKKSGGKTVYGPWSKTVKSGKVKR